MLMRRILRLPFWSTVSIEAPLRSVTIVTFFPLWYEVCRWNMLFGCKTATGNGQRTFDMSFHRGESHAVGLVFPAETMDEVGGRQEKG